MHSCILSVLQFLISVQVALIHIASSSTDVFAAYSKDYLTELVAFVAVASPQHHSVDSLTDFAVNLTAGPLIVVAAVAKECWAVVLAEFAAQKAAGAWTVHVAAACRLCRLLEAYNSMFCRLLH